MIQAALNQHSSTRVVGMAFQEIAQQDHNTFASPVPVPDI
jgi:hypothetical protein